MISIYIFICILHTTHQNDLKCNQASSEQRQEMILSFPCALSTPRHQYPIHRTQTRCHVVCQELSFSLHSNGNHLRIHPKHTPANKDAFSSIKRLTRKGQANKLATLTYACTKADKQANVRRHVEGVNRNGQYYCGRTKRGVSRESSDWTYRFTGREARLVVVGDCLSYLC